MYYPPIELVKAGVMAEKHGFDTIWVQDHFTDLPPSGDRVDPWVIMTAVGVQTHKVRLGPGVTDVQRLHPAKMAHIISTLDDLIQGRTMLAIGAGEAMNVVPYGLPWEPPTVRVERLKETIQVMRLLWKSRRDEPLSFTGSYYRLDKAWLDQHPYQNRSPNIYIGALGAPRTLRLVGEVADGWFPWFNTPETFKKRVGIIEEGAKRAGRSLDDIDLVALFYVALTDDEQLKKKAINAVKAEILVLNRRDLLKNMGYEVKSAENIDYDYQHVLATHESATVAATLSADMPDEVAAQFMLVGSPDDCIETIERFVKLGAKHVVVRDAIGQYLFGSVEKGEETLRNIGQNVIPYFRNGN
jgi:alkanesulfonate monooxygenase SsuD/methylene tetrahydromethanopterin reductase-like flavin-dependent oxidoreductase (luciferase family)